MIAALKSAWVITRRDFVATVFSRSFLLFLMGPLLALGFGGLTAASGKKADDEALRSSVAVVGSNAEMTTLRDAYLRLEKRVGEGSLPDMRFETAGPDPMAQARSLLAMPKDTATAVLVDPQGKPRLVGPARNIARIDGDMELLLDEVATSRALASAGIQRPATQIDRVIIDPVGGGSKSSRHLLGRAAQTLLFMLTMMLAGMMLSNLVEEKSNKVIEVLAAALPVDRIFMGKLIAMVGVSLTGITVWGAVAAIALMKLLPPGVPMPVPAVGWPMMALLSVVYYVTNYMILGGIFLGIGAQASSVREVQTLSMPVTMAQLGLFAMVSAVAPGDTGAMAQFAAIFPLSSPLAMIGRAASEPVLWIHAVAIAWQLLWVAIIVRFAARRFRTGVLKSGSGTPPRRWWRRPARFVAPERQTPLTGV